MKCISKAAVAVRGVAAAVRGASERLVPIVMTSTVTALGLLPLALSPNSAGREIEGRWQS